MQLLHGYINKVKSLLVCFNSPIRKGNLIAPISVVYNEKTCAKIEDNVPPLPIVIHYLERWGPHGTAWRCHGCNELRQHALILALVLW